MDYAPTDEMLADHADAICAALNIDGLTATVIRGELTLAAPAAKIVAVLTHLREAGDCQYGVLLDICGVDYPEREQRFEVVYHLLSMRQNQRIRIKVSVNEDVLVPSVTGVYPAADWYEREVYDMYGVMFSDHPDLRRILTDYGFRGWPLRKDFPVTGYVEVRYDETQKRVVYEPVTLTQEFRQFDFLSPWEGVQDMLPGDDKAAEAKG